MNKTRWIAGAALLLLSLGFASTAVGQEKKKITIKAQERRVGVGIGVNPISLAPTAIYVPINVSKQFRVEPEVGFAISTQNSVDMAGNSEETSTQALRFGIGAFFVQRLGQTVRLYIGPRFTALLTTTEMKEADTERTQTILNFTGALGGEYLFTARFSVGMEAQINFTSIGESEFTAGGETNDGGDDGTIFSTGSVVFFRTYF